MREARPTGRQIRRRRAVAVAVLALVAVGAAYLVLAATVLAPVDKHGAKLVELEIHSRAVGRELGLNLIVPEKLGPRGQRSLVVMLHGRSGDENTFNDTVFEGLGDLRGRRAPVYAFPAGGVHGYWHDRADGDWGSWVTDEVIPSVVRRFGIDPQRIALAGISMGGFGAYDLALKHPGRFCAVGGHSPALWFERAETAPGAFDDEADFERNDVVGTVEADPEAFGSTKVWNDYGSEDPFRPYDEGFVQALEAGSADLTAHSWPGRHEASYWHAHWPAYQRFYVKALAACG